jgi:hypothetical protein
MLEGLWNQISSFFTIVDNALKAFFDAMGDRILGLLGLGSGAGSADSGNLLNTEGNFWVRLFGGQIGTRAIGDYNINKEGLYYLHDGEQVSQRTQQSYQGSNSPISIGTMQLQVIASNNPDYDADRLFDAFMQRMRREGERVMA